MGYTDNTTIDDQEPSGNPGDFNEGIPLHDIPEEYTAFSEVEFSLGRMGIISFQADGFGSVSAGKEVGVISTGKDLDFSIISARVNPLDGEAFLRAQTFDSDLETTTRLTDAGLLNLNIGNLDGRASFYDNPLEAHHDNQHLIGIRTLKEVQGIENGTLTLTGTAGVTLGGDQILNAGFLRTVDGEKWNRSYGMQATFDGDGPRLDAGITATRDWETANYRGEFNLAAQVSMGADPTATLLADGTVRLSEDRVAKLGDTHFGKTAGKLSLDFRGVAQLEDSQIDAKASMGLGYDLPVGKAVIEVEKEFTREEQTNVTLGFRIPL